MPEFGLIDLTHILRMVRVGVDSMDIQSPHSARMPTLERKRTFHRFMTSPLTAGPILRQTVSRRISLRYILASAITDMGPFRYRLFSDPIC